VALFGADDDPADMTKALAMAQTFKWLELNAVNSRR